MAGKHDKGYDEDSLKNEEYEQSQRKYGYEVVSSQLCMRYRDSNGNWHQVCGTKVEKQEDGTWAIKSTKNEK